jgi:hypothetical protein
LKHGTGFFNYEFVAHPQKPRPYLKSLAWHAPDATIPEPSCRRGFHERKQVGVGKKGEPIEVDVVLDAALYFRVL